MSHSIQIVVTFNCSSIKDIRLFIYFVTLVSVLPYLRVHPVRFAPPLHPPLDATDYGTLTAYNTAMHFKCKN